MKISVRNQSNQTELGMGRLNMSQELWPAEQTRLEWTPLFGKVITVLTNYYCPKVFNEFISYVC